MLQVITSLSGGCVVVLSISKQRHDERLWYALYETYMLVLIIVIYLMMVSFLTSLN